MKMLIAGEERDSSNGEVIYVTNPATQQVIDSVPKSTFEDIQEALDHAVDAKKAWRNVPVYERSNILMNYAELLREHKTEISTMVCYESGKTLQSCLDELDSCINVFRAYAEKARNFSGKVMPRDSEKRVVGDVIFNYPEPLGVVVSIVPYNYPIELFAHKVAPALVMGNTVVVKPATETPLGNIMMTKLLVEAGVHPGAIQIITGRGSEIGNWFSESPKIDLISVTGSTAVGIQVAQQAANNLTHVLLELGGNDPLIIFDDADIPTAVGQSIVGRASNAGQTCCGTKRFIVHNKIKAEFEKQLIAELKEFVVGDPLNPKTFYGPLVSERAAKNVEQQINETLEEGGRLIFGGKRFNHAFIEPTVITDVKPEMAIAKDLEIFGPVFPIIGFDTVEEAIEIANSSCYGLSSGVMTASMEIAMKVANEIESGTCVIGGTGNYRSAHMPFGGPKMTGIGREGVTETLSEYSQIKNVVLKGFGH